MRTMTILSTILTALSVTSSAFAQTMTPLLNRFDITHLMVSQPEMKMAHIQDIIEKNLLIKLNDAKGFTIAPIAVDRLQQRDAFEINQFFSYDLEGTKTGLMTCHWSSTINEIDSCEQEESGAILVSIGAKDGSHDIEPMMIQANYKFIKVYIGGDPRTAEKPHDIKEHFVLSADVKILNLF